METARKCQRLSQMTCTVQCSRDEIALHAQATFKNATLFVETWDAVGCTNRLLVVDDEYCVVRQVRGSDDGFLFTYC